MSKVLFVYPNKEGYPIIPLGISVLSGILKHYNHTVELFDVTFMVPKRLDHEAREKTGTVKPVDMSKYWGGNQTEDIEKKFVEQIKSFNPDLIAFSIVENNYSCARELFEIAKRTTPAPIVVGGLFPTTVPDFFINDKNVDFICIGEGEYAIKQLADNIGGQDDISNIPNLIIKKNGNVIKNELSKYYAWEAPEIFQDWEIFDNRHLLKPFMGEMYRTGFFELSRGCPFNCSYCLNHFMQQEFKGLGKYTREKPIDVAIREMVYLKTKWSLELIFFNDENFLTMRDERFLEFCDEYENKVKLPFFIMTRADSLLNKDKIQRLKNAGCVTIGIGIETGNEEIRKKLLNKNISNDVFRTAFDNCHQYNLRTTANIMIGLPFETENNILESARFCKELGVKSLSLAIFAPYYGTKLRKICIESGFIEDRYYEGIATINHSILEMPQLGKNKIEELYYKFNGLVFDP